MASLRRNKKARKMARYWKRKMMRTNWLGNKKSIRRWN